MNLNEACTAVSEEMPIITVILNNQFWDGVSVADSLLWQTLFIHNTRKKDRFRKGHRGFGGKGFHVDTEEGFKEAFKQALQEKRPCLDLL